MPGTWIRATRQNTDQAVVGIAGRKGFTAIQVEKSLMNQELGFGRRMLQVLEDHRHLVRTRAQQHRLDVGDRAR